MSYKAYISKATFLVAQTHQTLSCKRIFPGKSWATVMFVDHGVHSSS